MEAEQGAVSKICCYSWCSDCSFAWGGVSLARDVPDFQMSMELSRRSDYCRMSWLGCWSCGILKLVWLRVKL